MNNEHSFWVQNVHPITQLQKSFTNLPSQALKICTELGQTPVKTLNSVK